MTDADCTNPAAPTCLPDNTCGGPVDACEIPGTIECGGSVTFDNTGFTTAPSDPVFSCRIGGAEQGVGAAWYTFVPTGTSACLDTNSSAVSDTLLAVYETCVSGELGCADDGGDGFKSALCVNGLTPGETYYVQVASWSAGSLGSITLDLTCEVCGDGTCSDGESGFGPDYCAQDCCGDGICEAIEEFGLNYCGADCCGDGFCSFDESGFGPDYCAQDCCGDGFCSLDEVDGPDYCAQDCCGDGFCSLDEADGPDYCAQDCCGDGLCAESEDGNCPSDCDT